MADIDAQTLQEFREIFQLVDLDHGGTIDKDELAVLMQTCQIKVTQVRPICTPWLAVTDQ